MLKSILPELKALLTSKIRGSTQHLWCRTTASDLPPLSWGLAHLAQGSTHFASAGNLNSSKTWETNTPPNSQGLSWQSCRREASPACTAPGEPLKLISNIALCLYTTGEKSSPTPTCFPPASLLRTHQTSQGRKPETP